MDGKVQEVQLLQNGLQSQADQITALKEKVRSYISFASTVRLLANAPSFSQKNRTPNYSNILLLIFLGISFPTSKCHINQSNDGILTKSVIIEYVVLEALRDKNH